MGFFLLCGHRGCRGRGLIAVGMDSIVKKSPSGSLKQQGCKVYTAVEKAGVTLDIHLDPLECFFFFSFAVAAVLLVYR